MSSRKTHVILSRIKKRIEAELLIADVLLGAHLSGSDGEGEKIAVFFQGMRQRETVIDDDILRG